MVRQMFFQLWDQEVAKLVNHLGISQSSCSLFYGFIGIYEKGSKTGVRCYALAVVVNNSRIDETQGP
jgi:hypothetical protein